MTKNINVQSYKVDKATLFYIVKYNPNGPLPSECAGVPVPQVLLWDHFLFFLQEVDIIHIVMAENCLFNFFLTPDVHICPCNELAQPSPIWITGRVVKKKVNRVDKKKKG